MMMMTKIVQISNYLFMLGDFLIAIARKGRVITYVATPSLATGNFKPRRIVAYNLEDRDIDRKVTERTISWETL